MIVNRTAGICRIVLIFRKFVIKIPKAHHGQKYFVDGMLNNLYERNQYKTLEKYLKSHHYPILGKAYFCGFLGLFLIMKRYELLGRKLTRAELKEFKIHKFDNHAGNTGMDENGHIVLLDYGNHGFYIY